MKKILVLLLVTIGFVSFAQVSDDFDPATIGVDKANTEVKQYLVDAFDSESSWYPIISKDVAFPHFNYFDRKNKPAEENTELYDINNKAIVNGEGYKDLCLGVKIHYTKRATKETLFVKRYTPAHLAGVTKAFSLWVCGRNYGHKLFLRVLTSDNKTYDLPFNEGRPLSFYGWKKITCAVPSTVDQEDFPYLFKSNFKVVGLVLEFNQDDMTRDLYIYFDDLRAYTDVSFITNASKIDDMVDEW